MFGEGDTPLCHFHFCHRWITTDKNNKMSNVLCINSGTKCSWDDHIAALVLSQADRQIENTLTWPCRTAPATSFSALWSWRKTQSHSGPGCEWGRIHGTTRTEKDKQKNIQGRRLNNSEHLRWWRVGERRRKDRWGQRDAKWRRDALGRASSKAEGVERANGAMQRMSVKQREGKNELVNCGTPLLGFKQHA